MGGTYFFGFFFHWRLLDFNFFGLNPPNKGPPWTIGGALFLGPRGWTSIRALVDIFSILYSMSLQKGVDFYLDCFFGVRGWTSIRENKQEGRGFKGRGAVIQLPTRDPKTLGLQ